MASLVFSFRRKREADTPHQGTYLVSGSIISYYYTQLIGDVSLTRKVYVSSMADQCSRPTFPSSKLPPHLLGSGSSARTSMFPMAARASMEMPMNGISTRYVPLLPISPVRPCLLLLPQANFYRQIRNFIIDITATDQGAYVAALHYQVAQATSLTNIKFVASQNAGTTQQAICE